MFYLASVLVLPIHILNKIVYVIFLEHNDSNEVQKAISVEGNTIEGQTEKAVKKTIVMGPKFQSKPVPLNTCVETKTNAVPTEYVVQRQTKTILSNTPAQSLPFKFKRCIRDRKVTETTHVKRGIWNSELMMWKSSLQFIRRAMRWNPTPRLRTRAPNQRYRHKVRKEIRNMLDGFHAEEGQRSKSTSTTFDGDSRSCFVQPTYAIQSSGCSVKTGRYVKQPRGSPVGKFYARIFLTMVEVHSYGFHVTKIYHPVCNTWY